MENDTIQYQPRTTIATNREVLDQVTDDICRNEAEMQALREYKSLYDIHKLEGEAYLSARRMIEVLPTASNEFKMYKRYKKYIEEHMVARNAEFQKLESDENIKYPLQQAWRIYYEQERERDRRTLENWRRNREIEAEKAAKLSAEIQAKRVEIPNNYKNIDNALSMERDLRYKCSEKISEAEVNEKRETRSEIRFVCIAGIVGIVILTILFYLILPVGNFLPHLLVALVVVSSMSIHGLIADLKKITARSFELKNQYKKDTEKEIIEMYYHLLSGKNLYMFLGVPDDVVLDSYKSLPKDTKAGVEHKFGKYTRYIAPYGAKYHLKYGCSAAFTQVHLFAMGNREPCLHCANRDSAKLPEWYVYLNKLKPVIERYPFLFDLSIKPYD